MVFTVSINKKSGHGIRTKVSDTTYLTYFPDLLNIFAVGNSLDEARDNSRIALQRHVDKYVRAGYTLPKPKYNLSYEDNRENSIFRVTVELSDKL